MADEFGEELRDDLREAVAAATQPSEAFIDLVMSGYDLTTDDVDVAELVFDSATAEVAIRAAELDTRLLRFDFGETSIEVEVRDDSYVIGTIEPAPGALRLEQDGGSQELELDGPRFEVSVTSLSPLRLKVQTTDGEWFATEWIIP